MTSTLHVVGLPHTHTDGTYSTCAYTEKVRKFCDMMTGGDRRVVLYGSEFNVAACDEHVVCVNADQRERWFGPQDETSLTRGGFDWNANSPWWAEMNTRAIGEIRARADDKDLLVLTSGTSQQPISDALSQLTLAEGFVGYEGIIIDRPGPGFAAFESHSHRHLVYGLKGWRRGREYDVVIPNWFDVDVLPQGNGAGDYLLFMGRLIHQKGVHVAALIAHALDMRLVVAGPGATEWGDGYVRFPEGEARAPKLEYVGSVGPDERATLMGDAAVTLMPTLYVEPFGGVAVESMICGTPAVTTDFGAFTETVVEGVTGYRFQTLQEAVDATEAAMLLDRTTVRDHAAGLYSLDAIEPLFDRWFTNLDGLWGEGWTALRPRLEAVA
jgi:hypothetical protein